MSDDDTVGDDEKLAHAKTEVLAALGHYVDGWSSTQGDVVTKFYCVVEVIDAGGGRTLVECNGYADLSTLMSWDRSGLLYEVLNDPRSRMGYTDD